MELHCFEFDGKWYVTQVDSENFWEIQIQGREMKTLYITDDSRRRRLIAEIDEPPNPIFPGDEENA